MKWLVISFFLTCLLSFVSCRKDKPEPDTKGYPEKVAKIVLTRCSVNGCHNTASAETAYGLDLSTWDNLFKGSYGNSSVIPYRADQSFLFYSVNSYHELGPMLEPMMPLNSMAPLNHEEVLNIRDWINQGAPDDMGNVKFSGNPQRSKVYVVNQGCDLVTVFDHQSKLVMRCVDVGNSDQIESPHDILASPDGSSWFVSFFGGNVIQKYDATNDVKTGELSLNTISWHAMSISGDSKVAMAVHWEVTGVVAIFNPVTMELISQFGIQNFPHGCAMNQDGKRAYVTSQQGNYITKLNLTDPMSPEQDMIVLQPGEFPTSNGIYKPYEVDFSPDWSKYFVTCQGTNEVRVFNASNDSLLKVLPTAGVPQLISFSQKFPYAFVSNMEDSSNSQTVSAVNVIDMNSLEIVKTVFTGHQPRGLTVDDANECVWVANRNISAVGAAPHHTSACGGRNGYVTLMNMNTLTLVNGWHTETAVDPYSVIIRK